MRRSKIVCTLGPAVDSEEQLVSLIEAGMNVARFSSATAPTPSTRAATTASARPPKDGPRGGRARRPPGAEDPPGDLRRGPRRAGAR